MPSVVWSALIERVNVYVPSPAFGLLVIVTFALPDITLPTKSFAFAVPSTFCQ